MDTATARSSSNKLLKGDIMRALSSWLLNNKKLYPQRRPKK